VPASETRWRRSYESIAKKVSRGIEGWASGAPGVTGEPPRLLDQARVRVHRLGLARRTEEAYVSWIRRFIVNQSKLAGIKNALRVLPGEWLHSECPACAGSREMRRVME